MSQIRAFQVVFCGIEGCTELPLGAAWDWQSGGCSVASGPRSSRTAPLLFVVEVLWLLLTCLSNVRALHSISFEQKRAGKDSSLKKSVFKPLTPKLPYKSQFVGAKLFCLLVRF